jgi:hypothetical protein
MGKLELKIIVPVGTTYFNIFSKCRNRSQNRRIEIRGNPLMQV